MKHSLWDHGAMERLFVYLTPATDQAKVLVSIYVGSGSGDLVETERYVWSWEAPRQLLDDVTDFLVEDLRAAVLRILVRQSLMDGEALTLSAPDDPST